jgi:glycosyltransferase involved in cell wall biosynthesis
MNPLVSVLIPVHDGARFLPAALESALAQTFRPHEIVVVDDGSTDGSGDLARAVGARVVVQPHQGVAAARNRALDEATGDLIAFLDSDDCWTPDKLEVQVGAMLERPAAGFSVTHQQVTLEPGIAQPHWIAAGESLCCGTASLMVWRWAFDRVGRFDPARRLAEDTDWIVRALDLGMEMLVVPRPLLLRRIHGANLSCDRDPRDLFAVLRRSLQRKRGHP